MRPAGSRHVLWMKCEEGITRPVEAHYTLASLTKAVIEPLHMMGRFVSGADTVGITPKGQMKPMSDTVDAFMAVSSRVLA